LNAFQLVAEGEPLPVLDMRIFDELSDWRELDRGGAKGRLLRYSGGTFERDCVRLPFLAGLPLRVAVGGAVVCAKVR